MKRNKRLFLVFSLIMIALLGLGTTCMATDIIMKEDYRNRVDAYERCLTIPVGTTDISQFVSNSNIFKNFSIDHVNLRKDNDPNAWIIDYKKGYSYGNGQLTVNSSLTGKTIEIFFKGNCTSGQNPGWDTNGDSTADYTLFSSYRFTITDKTVVDFENMHLFLEIIQVKLCNTQHQVFLLRMYKQGQQ